MASLRNIMNNVDDDSQIRIATDKATTNSLQHSSPPPMPNYPASSDLPMHHLSPSNYSRGASPQGLYLHKPESSASRQSHQQMSLPCGRRSSTGSEHLAYSYSHGGSYIANHDMRPTMPGNFLPETGVKLTPITGRVSRAKKGVPVHTCDMCRPPKTFTRAEHLRRHQLSHQPPDLACSVPGCTKVFHRKDLLERHQQRHEQDERLAATARPRPNTSPQRHGHIFGNSLSSTATQLGTCSTTSDSSIRSIASTQRQDAPRAYDWTSANRSLSHSLPLSSRMPASREQYYTHSPQGRYFADSAPASQLNSPIPDSVKF